MVAWSSLLSCVGSSLFVPRVDYSIGTVVRPHFVGGGDCGRVPVSLNNPFFTSSLFVLNASIG